MLRELRLERHIGLRTMAKRLGIDRGYLSKIERGERLCSLDIATRLATALDVSKGELPALIRSIVNPKDARIAELEAALEKIANVAHLCEEEALNTPESMNFAHDFGDIRAMAKNALKPVRGEEVAVLKAALKKGE
jgi:transcriptional regulator with XRE-family HTH domain